MNDPNIDKVVIISYEFWPMVGAVLLGNLVTIGLIVIVGKWDWNRR